MTSVVREAFLTLLRMGLWHNSQEDLSVFPLQAEEWSLVMEVAKAQTVEGIVYEGILLLPEQYYPPQALLMSWVARIDSIERNNNKLSEALYILTKGFRQEGIDFMLLKGLGLGNNYIKPSVRVGGDLDLYFASEEDFHKANSLVASKGIRVKKGDHNSRIYLFRKVEVEHHTKMIDIFNPFVQERLAVLMEEEEGKRRSFRIKDVEVQTPSFVMAHVQASSHILKHYMGFGVGLRQFCDVARLSITQPDEREAQKLREIYKQLGLERWMWLMYSFLVLKLGLPKEFSPYTETEEKSTEKLLEDILHSGNFGFHDIRYRKGEVKRSERYSKRDAVFKRIMPHLVFLLRIVPQEVFWYPLYKAYTKVFAR